MLDENPNAESESHVEAPAATPDSDAAAPAEAPVKKAAKKATRRTTKKAAVAEPQLELDADATAADATAADSGEPEAAAPARKTAKKAAAKKTTAKKTAAKKTAAKATAAKKTTAKKTAAKKAATAVEESEGQPVDATGDEAAEQPAKKAPAKRATRKKAAKVTEPAEQVVAVEQALDAEVPETDAAAETQTAEAAPAVKKTARRSRAKKATPPVEDPAAPEAENQAPVTEHEVAETEAAVAPLFQAPTKTRRSRSRKAAETTADEARQAVATDVVAEGEPASDATAGSQDQTDEQEPAGEQTASEGADEKAADESAATATDADEASDDNDNANDNEQGQGSGRRRRRRGGRRRRRGGSDNGEQADTNATGSSDDGDDNGDKDGESGATDDSSDDGQDGTDDSSEGSSSRRRRRRRRAGDNTGDSADDPANTVTRVRQGRSAEDQITAVSGSTRLEAKKQRRREGREAGRRRAPIVSEAEFLARREAVDRVMVVRQKGELTQIGVLEDKVLVEHYVSRESQNSLIGNVYLGRVQNVLPSMEAAFIDIGKGRNAVLYAGEVNWSALGHKEGQPRKIESVLSSGQSVLVQVTKDPIGHKGARLTSQVSLAGRFLVYVPDGTTAGISRKLPDTERARLKGLLKEIVPDAAGVIVRTAAEGASEEELTRDVERLKARWEDIEAKSKQGSGPKLLYGEPDLTLKVVRDLFTEDFSKLIVEGDDAWDTVHDYVQHVAPDLLDRVEQFESGDGGDSFAVHRIDEQIAKGVDRKVWLPSGGSLVIDRTEAMTVVDVNTGKFTGSGGNLEETVTKNNLEAAEEIVRQLRLRDIGGIIVVDFIDMVLESNRDLVLRRLVECLGRDRTRHQVAEVTSLGLVQMTRKRISTGLLEAFSETCEHCHGRGVVVHDMPVEPRRNDDDNRRGGRRGRGKGDNQKDQKNDGGNNKQSQTPKSPPPVPTPADVAAVARPDSEPVEAAADSAPREAADPKAATPQVVETDNASAGSAGAAPEKSSRRSRGRSRGRGSAGQSDAQTDATPGDESAGDESTPVDQTTEVSAAAEQSAERRAAEAKPAESAVPVETPTTPAQPGEAAESPAAPAAPPQVSTVTRSRRAARSGVITPKASEPVDVPVETPTAAAPAEPVAPPKVVTRSRRRQQEAEPAAEAVEQADVDSDSDADAGDLSVPVKKRGSRKR